MGAKGRVKQRESALAVCGAASRVLEPVHSRGMLKVVWVINDEM